MSPLEAHSAVCSLIDQVERGLRDFGPNERLEETLRDLLFLRDICSMRMLEDAADVAGHA